jgi:4-amino-4-deoxy-L-arabinose transferase-like glycosyltransferase
VSALARPTPRLVAAFLALGILLRLVGLGIHSLWIDEAATLYVAHCDDITAALRGDRHPPLSYLLFRGWIALFGEDDAWLRVAPALASIASLLLTARLARAWLSEHAVWIAVAITAVSPLELWIAREVRMYAFVECAALIAIVAAWEHLLRPRAWLLAVVFGASAAATGLHYFGAFVGPTIALLAAAQWGREPSSKKRCAALAAAALAGALAWLPWFTSVYRDQSSVPASFLANISVRGLLEFPARLLVPTTDMLPSWCVTVAYAAAALVSLACLMFVIECVRSRRPGDVAAAVVLATPPACALLVALVGPLNFLARYFAASMPGASLAVASGLASLRSARLRLAATTVLLTLLATISFAIHSRNDREDWRTACEHVARDFTPGDRILPLTHLTDAYSQAPLRHYWRDKPELLSALTTLAAARDATGLRPRLHVIYRETRYISAEYQDLATRYRLLATESLHGAIHRMLFE